jgi:hypothetical protein
MTHLSFQSILPTGSRELGDAKGPGGSGVFDYFFDRIGLPDLAEGPALIVLAAKKVHLEKNFITINAPDAVCDQSFEEASGQLHFVWRFLPNPSDTWVLQMHQIPAGRLMPTGNRIGIHTRNAQGLPARVRDEFAVARLFLIYPSAS